MGKNNVKYTIEQVRDICNNNGYELLDDVYINSKTKINIQDNEGYKYYLILTNKT